MDAIFTLAIRQSFGLSLPQPSTPQIRPDSIISPPMSVAIWAFRAQGQQRNVLKDFEVLKVKKKVVVEKGLVFIISCIAECFTGPVNKK